MIDNEPLPLTGFTGSSATLERPDTAWRARSEASTHVWSELNDKSEPVFHYIAAVKSFISPDDEPFEEKTVSKAPRRAVGSSQRQLDFPSNRLEQSRVPSVVYATPPS